LFSYLTDIPYDGSVSNYSIASRQVVDDVLRMRESVKYYPGFLFWLGYPSGFLDVQHDARFSGSTSYTFGKLWKHSQNIIFAHSTRPLELCVTLGLIVAVLAVIVGFGYLVWTAAYGSAVSGWASLIICSTSAPGRSSSRSESPGSMSAGSLQVKGPSVCRALANVH
jgi:dolichol-phosphate mannosyltransferase